MRPLAILLVLAGCAAPSTSPGGAADLATVDAAAADLAGGDLGQSVCGNGNCEPGEDGAGCGSDCCDAMTACDATRGNGGAFFCRSMNGGPFAWYTQADTTALCSDASQIGKTTFACAATSGTCCSLPGGYVDGACP
ncbi:MAG: hypothetical protein ACXVDD_03555 [Polyangia bacterium]